MSHRMYGEDEVDDGKRFKVSIHEKDLLCVNGCGFFGTPQWGNRCSTCWRSHQMVEKRNQHFAKNRTLLSFDNFQERRKLSTESRTSTLKKLLKSPSMIGSSNDSGSRHVSPTGSLIRSRAVSPDSREAREELSEFLSSTLPYPLVQELSKMIKNAAIRIHEESRAPPDELSVALQTFYQYLSDHLNSHPYFSSDDAKTKSQDVMEQVEKYLCVTCYPNLFCASSDEEVADLSLQDRIRSLNWVTAGFLETKIDFNKTTVGERLDDAISEMITMNSHRRADEKLSCLIKCSHFIFEALKLSGAPTSADEFLPVLIYVLLKGNPPLIQSNLKFISRFALPSRVMSGESGYFFTNLSCAMQFVQDMNHESLHMERSEFEAYTSGDLQPPLNLINTGCNHVLGSMEKSLNRVRQLIEKQHSLSHRIDEMERRLSVEEAELAEEFKNAISAFPSEKFLLLKKEIAMEERETAEICSLLSNLSTSSRSSGADVDTAKSNIDCSTSSVDLLQ